MSRLPYRSSITLAAVVVVLLSSRAADAQYFVAPEPPRQPVSWPTAVITGAWFEMKDEQVAAHRYEHLQEKYNRDVQRGDQVAAERDAYRLDKTQFRMAVDDFLIRKNTCQPTGCYPWPVRLDCISYNAIAQYHIPPRPPTRHPFH